MPVLCGYNQARFPAIVLEIRVCIKLPKQRLPIFESVKTCNYARRHRGALCGADGEVVDPIIPQTWSRALTRVALPSLVAIISGVSPFRGLAAFRLAPYPDKSPRKGMSSCLRVGRQRGYDHIHEAS